MAAAVASTSGGGPPIGMHGHAGRPNVTQNFFGGRNYPPRQRTGEREPLLRGNMPPHGGNERSINDMAGPGRRLRSMTSSNVRRHLDYVATVMKHLELRLHTRDWRDRPFVQADPAYCIDTLPVIAERQKLIDCVMLKFVRSAINKARCPIYTSCWSPEGKRLITGASTGEFTLWNGVMFNFETILQAHDSAVRALKWSHNDLWLVSADHEGFVKYWQPNMNNVHMYQAHKEPIRSLRICAVHIIETTRSGSQVCVLHRELSQCFIRQHWRNEGPFSLRSFCPTDVKLATGSDDGTARIWDMGRCVEERILRGHGADVRQVHWHPSKALIATGSRDSQQPLKLWDPKSGQCLATLHEHKNAVLALDWNPNGNWLLSGGRDHLTKLYDIRMMREIFTYRGHQKEVTAVAWHPIHESLFATGGGDGCIYYWTTDGDMEVGSVERAHEQAIWTLAWHPLGHVLASGSNDHSTKFWARNKPGDILDDFYGVTEASKTREPIKPSEIVKQKQVAPAPTVAAAVLPENEEEDSAISGSAIPGMGLDRDAIDLLAECDTVPHMDTSGPGQHQGPMRPHKKPLIKQPPPKKAQREMERMWNVARPDNTPDAAAVAASIAQGHNIVKPKQSLLGPAPPRPQNPLSILLAAGGAGRGRGPSLLGTGLMMPPQQWPGQMNPIMQPAMNHPMSQQHGGMVGLRGPHGPSAAASSMSGAPSTSMASVATSGMHASMPQHQHGGTSQHSPSSGPSLLPLPPQTPISAASSAHMGPPRGGNNMGGGTQQLGPMFANASGATQQLGPMFQQSQGRGMPPGGGSGPGGPAAPFVDRDRDYRGPAGYGNDVDLRRAGSDSGGTSPNSQRGNTFDEDLRRQRADARDPRARPPDMSRAQSHQRIDSTNFGPLARTGPPHQQQRQSPQGAMGQRDPRMGRQQNAPGGAEPRAPELTLACGSGGDDGAQSGGAGAYNPKRKWTQNYHDESSDGSKRRPGGDSRRGRGSQQNN